MTFLDCPAYLDGEGAARCGIPAEARCSYTMRSADGHPFRSPQDDSVRDVGTAGPRVHDSAAARPKGLSRAAENSLTPIVRVRAGGPDTGRPRGHCPACLLASAGLRKVP
jgi:hypothetical protein